MIFFILFIVWELDVIVLNVFKLCRIFFAVIVFLCILDLVKVIFLGMFLLRWWYIINILRCFFKVLIVKGWVGLVEEGNMFSRV